MERQEMATNEETEAEYRQDSDDEIEYRASRRSARTLSSSDGRCRSWFSAPSARRSELPYSTNKTAPFESLKMLKTQRAGIWLHTVSRQKMTAHTAKSRR